MAQPIVTGSAALTVRISALVALYTTFVYLDPIALILALIVLWLLMER
ncbi:hypothetical protein [Psychrobacter immobilis]